jgi:hypothetical protein
MTRLTKEKTMPTKRTTKRTTQAFATPMTGVEAFEAGRREYEAVAAGTTGDTPAAPAAAPSARPITMRTKHEEARPHFLPRKEGERKGG